MKQVARYLILAALLAVSCSSAQSQTQQAPQKPAPATRPYQERLQTPSQVSDKQKKEFLRMLRTLPHDSEFYTEAAIDKAGPYLPVLLALTEKDIEQYDIYRFAALSRGLCDRNEHRLYAVRYFSEIQHPLLRLIWAAMLFDADASSPEIVRFLQDALKSTQQTRLLSEIVGPQFKHFKKRVLAQSSTL